MSYMIKKIKDCPSCGHELIISELKCPNCDLRVRKDFSPCLFCQLSDEDYEFLLIFLRAQGKITDMEKTLDASYPTIKIRIDNLLKNLQLSPFEDAGDPIDALARGKISVDEAVSLLKQRRKK